jgi:hypothetical protein
MATAFAALLGYTGITEITGSVVSRGDAHVAVGMKRPNGTISTAAVIHLVLFGSGQYAPWEVVGISDTTFTLDRPGYGSTVGLAVTVGGTITGSMRTSGSPCTPCRRKDPSGAYCCRAVGGTRSPCSARVSFHASPGQVITIAAATGGHVAAVERFAVASARVG